MAIILAFIIFQVWIATGEEALMKYNSLGVYLNTLILLFFSMWNLTILFKPHVEGSQLVANPEFWFTVTIFAINVLDLIQSVIVDNTYISGNGDAFRVAGYIRNFIKVGLMYGYVRGIMRLG